MTRHFRLGSGRRYEHLLDGSQPDDSALSALLETARAPGTRDEMAGLPAARTAFMSVPYVRSRPAASVSRLPAATRAAAGRLLVLKVLVGVSGATLVGGAAYAATGAHFLNGSTPHKHSTSTSVPGRQHTGRGGLVQPGNAQPTPDDHLQQPAPATTHAAGDLNGKSSAARSEHGPSNPATPPGRLTDHSPQPRHTPTQQGTHTGNPSPGPRTEPAPARTAARTAAPPSTTGTP